MEQNSPEQTGDVLYLYGWPDQFLFWLRILVSRADVRHLFLFVLVPFLSEGFFLTFATVVPIGDQKHFLRPCVSGRWQDCREVARCSVLV